MVLFNLLAKLTLDKTAFDKDLDQAEKDAKDFKPETPELKLDPTNYQKEMKKAKEGASEFKTLWSDIKTAVVTAGVAAAVKGTFELIANATEVYLTNSDAIDQQTTKLHISAQAYQEWSHVMSASNGDIADLEDGIKNINALLGGEEIEKAPEAFEALGVSLFDANGNARKTEAILKETIKALARYGGDDRGALVSAIFGDKAEFDYLLKNGALGIDSLIAEAHDLGLIMSDEQIERGVNFNKSVDNLHEAMTGFQNNIGSVVTSLQGVVDLMAKVMAFFAGAGGEESTLDKTFKEIYKHTLASSLQLDKAESKAKGLIENLDELGDYWTLDEEGKMTWDALAAHALELFPQLSTYIDTDGKKIQGNTKDIEANISAWARLEKQRLLSAAMQEKAQAIADQYTAAYEKSAEARLKENDALGKRVEVIAAMNKKLNDNPEQKRLFGLDYKGATEVTEENFDQVLPFFKRGYQDAARNQIDAYEKMLADASTMRSDADKLIAEADEEQAKLLDYEQALTESMGLTDESVLQAKSDVEALTAAIDAVPDEKHTTFYMDSEDAFPHAKGSNYIPYDNYPALLHRGEAILTASEARRYREGSDFGDMSGLEDRIEAAIRRGMSGATVNSYLNGQDITDDVNRKTVRQLKARRFSG